MRQISILAAVSDLQDDLLVVCSMFNKPASMIDNRILVPQ